MDEQELKAIRLTGAAFVCAVIGKFINFHREHYGTQADYQDVTNFCLKLMFNYKGENVDINSVQTEMLIKRCMMEAKEWRVGA